MTKGQSLIIKEDKISLSNNPNVYVMMEWERPLMKRQNAMKIKDFVINHLKNNGIFSYFSLKNYDIYKFGDKLNSEFVQVTPDEDCNYCTPTITEVTCCWVRV